MTNVVEMYPEPGRAERLMEAADEGGITVVVQFDAQRQSTLLFSLHAVSAPTEAAMAAAIEMSTRFTANTDFREAVEHYCIQLGSAVHHVEEPAWKFRPLTSEETAALYAGRGA